MPNTALHIRRGCVPSSWHRLLEPTSLVIAIVVAGCLAVGTAIAGSDEKAIAKSADEANPNSTATVIAQQTPVDQNVPSVTAEEIRQWVQDLSSEQFGTRQQAIISLKRCPADQLREIGILIESEGSIEARKRWLELLALQYESLTLDSDALQFVSDALEKDAESDTWFVAESARKVLDRNWRRRVEIAVIQLNRINVPTDPRDPSKLWETDMENFGRPTSKQHLKLLIDHTFEDRPEALKLIRRLAPLRSAMFLRAPQLVSVILIDGHPLPDARLADIKGIFGDIAIQERGPACLGIAPNNQLTDGRGVLVESVAEGKSADLAGIQPGDLITSLDGEPLENFDDMVKRLRNYDIGDKVTLKISSHRNAGIRNTRDVEVTLTGWYDGATSAAKK